MFYGDTRLSKASPIKYLESFLQDYSPNVSNKFLVPDQGVNFITILKCWTYVDAISIKSFQMGWMHYIRMVMLNVSTKLLLLVSVHCFLVQVYQSNFDHMLASIFFASAMLCRTAASLLLHYNWLCERKTILRTSALLVIALQGRRKSRNFPWLCSSHQLPYPLLWQRYYSGQNFHSC